MLNSIGSCLSSVEACGGDRYVRPRCTAGGDVGACTVKLVEGGNSAVPYEGAALPLLSLTPPLMMFSSSLLLESEQDAVNAPMLVFGYCLDTVFRVRRYGVPCLRPPLGLEE